MKQYTSHQCRCKAKVRPPCAIASGRRAVNTQLLGRCPSIRFRSLSIKGKVFRSRVTARRRRSSTRRHGTSIPYLDVILVNASPHLSKTYYIKGFEEGDARPPRLLVAGLDPPRSVSAEQGQPDLRRLPDEHFRLRAFARRRAASAAQGMPGRAPRGRGDARTCSRQRSHWCS